MALVQALLLLIFANGAVLSTLLNVCHPLGEAKKQLGSEGLKVQILDPSSIGSLERFTGYPKGRCSWMSYRRR